MSRVPKGYPVRVLRTAAQCLKAKRPTTCGTCGRTWDDAIVTGMTPAPSGRCPFEAYHDEPEPRATPRPPTAAVELGRMRKALRRIVRDAREEPREEYPQTYDGGYQVGFLDALRQCGGIARAGLGLTKPPDPS
jgi:hypothetical protein